MRRYTSRGTANQPSSSSAVTHYPLQPGDVGERALPISWKVRDGTDGTDRAQPEAETSLPQLETNHKLCSPNEEAPE